MPEKIKAVGSRAQVFHGTAKHTSGGLKKSDLMKKKGRIISRRKSVAGKKAIKHLRALGFIAKKGTFKLFRKGDAKKSHKSHSRKSHKGKRHTRRRRGGADATADAIKSMMGVVSGKVASGFYGGPSPAPAPAK
jgi:hypothetical protein